ncbi:MULTISPECIES: glycosyltransferase family 4 protein [unclassified Francisella]|uniref:glycosyltransferase family 4 protein n=1 Tax=unclassified Francisella TaxID=2610885 RepID=UPI002E351E9B|nr:MULTISPECIES: glycosyltransferase family 1 protein [unclassified Francisella]MED7820025.1 glycosyltransferase family 1 protein [Francisella sp. 19S2-4]MED7830845.1 glycosyltransferase family 1 protein [Francisella sp. 19S2-10]
MRIVIDLQGSQSESRYRGIGRYSLSLAKAIAKNRGNHEIVIALSALFPHTIEELKGEFQDLLPSENIRVWGAIAPTRECEDSNETNREVSEVLREAFLLNLQPDIILITSFFEGFVDDAVTSIKKIDMDTKVAVILYDLIPFIQKEIYLAHNQPYKNHYTRKIEEIKKADLLLGISQSASDEAIKYLDFDQNNIFNISSAVDEVFAHKILIDDEKQSFYEKYSVTKKTIVYAPGGFDIRKNFENLIKAYAKLPNTLKEQYQLVIVSKVDDVNRERLLKLAKDEGIAKDDLILTGYVSDEDLIAFYSLCDLFVFSSTHEGFGLPVLEAMNCGAVIIGSNTTSIPEVIGCEEALFDPYSIESIRDKIAEVLTDEVLQSRLKEHNQLQVQKFSWDRSSKVAIEAIENLSVQNSTATYTIEHLISQLVEFNLDKLHDTELFHLASVIDANFCQKNKRVLFIDITQLRMVDYGTGIQRVVRSIISELYKLHQDELEFEINLVYLEHQDGMWNYKRACDYEKKHFDIVNLGDNYIISACHNDVFLGLDLVCLVVDAEQQLLFTKWKNSGVKIVFVVYDILPILHPQWWPDGGSDMHKNWLTTIAKISDTLISISKAVSDETRHWIESNCPNRPNPIKYDFFHLGADIENSSPSKGMPNNAVSIINLFQTVPTFLMVGTLEPRKGHQQTLKAFTALWDSDIDVNLLIVGKSGWRVEDIQDSIKNHKKLNKQLFWLEGISDEYLEKVYAASTCLIVASEGEGFGLPLIESAQHNVPIIARDIPVFREVAGDYAYYFENSLDPMVIQNTVKSWIELYKKDKHPKSDNMPWQTWEQSAQQLMDIILKDNRRVNK